MNIIQCQFCKKPFQSLGRRICPACLEQIDRDFITVRDYIYEHKITDMDTVAEETGVSKQIILHLLKEGRLELGGDGGSGGVLQCEACKKPITTGRLCRECMDKVSSTMQKSIDTKPSPPKNDSASFKGAAKLKN